VYGRNATALGMWSQVVGKKNNNTAEE
jgi:hypothetical protein